MVWRGKRVFAIPPAVSAPRSGGGLYIGSSIISFVTQFVTQNNGTMEFNDCSSEENGVEPQG